MKIGSEKKGEVIALVVLLAVAAVMLWRALAPDSSPAVSAPAAAAVAAPAVPVPAAATSAPSSNVSSVAAPAPAVPDDPTLHLDELTRLRAIEYTGTGRDLFHMGAAPLPPAARSAVASAKAAAAAARLLPPPGPPPPPPIPLKFYGFAQSAGTPEKIFLQMGEDNFVVTQGETIAHRYLIENIGKVSVRVKDLQTNSEQELPLQQG